MFRGTTLFLVGIAGAVIFAQAPEFTQQYRQRLGGALYELQTIVTQFDADAAQHGLSRHAALQRYRTSPDSFFRTRGLSVGEIITRYERVDAQNASLQSSSALMRPILLAQRRDDQIMRDTMQAFRPAVPTTPEGGVYALGGFFSARFVWAMLLSLLGFRRRHGRA